MSLEKLKMLKMKNSMFLLLSGWIRFVKSQYPNMVDNCLHKSHQQMFGAITKSYYAELLDVTK